MRGALGHAQTHKEAAAHSATHMHIGNTSCTFDAGAVGGQVCAGADRGQWKTNTQMTCSRQRQ